MRVFFTTSLITIITLIHSRIVAVLVVDMQTLTAVLCALALPCITSLKFHIGLIQDPSESEVNTSVIRSVLSKWNNPFDDFMSSELGLKIVNVTESCTKLSENALKLARCRDVLLYLSTDRCYDVTSVNRVPVVHINRQAHCELNATQEDWLYPKRLTLGGMIRGLFANDTLDNVNIFYELESESYMRSVLSAFSPRPTTLLLMSDAVDESAMGRIVRSPCNPTSPTNNVILCNRNCTLRILREANLWESENRLREVSKYCSRWLLITTESATVTAVWRHLQQLDNVAVLRVMPEVPREVMNSRFEEVVDILMNTLRNFVRNNPANINNLFQYDAAGCAVINSNLSTNYVQPALAFSDGYKWCAAYEIYTVSRDGNTRDLQPISFCDDQNTPQLIDVFPNEHYAFKRAHLKIATLTAQPFVNEVVSDDGTVSLEGFCIDLLDALSSVLNFTYSIYLTPDQVFGVDENKNGSWDGLVGLLQRKEVDMALATLSVTAERAKVIDFVAFFQEHGSILIHKETAERANLLVLIQPFRWQLWLSVICSVPCAGLVAWLLTRLKIRLDDDHRDEFSNAHNSSWYAFGAILLQGGAYEPQSMAARLFVGCWWMFAIVIVTTYGGSLISFLTVNRNELPFKTLEELIENEKITWGILGKSVYEATFLGSNSTSPLFRAVREGIMRFSGSDPDVISTDLQQHVNKVMRGGYAFIHDRSQLISLAYANTQCELAVLDKFSSLLYGIGLQKDSPFKIPLTESIALLQRTGMMRFFERKWLPQKSCNVAVVPEAVAISLRHSQTAFYLLCTGIMAASLVLAMELCSKCLVTCVRCRPTTTTIDSPVENCCQPEHVKSPGHHLFDDVLWK